MQYTPTSLSPGAPLKGNGSGIASAAATPVDLIDHINERIRAAADAVTDIRHQVAHHLDRILGVDAPHQIEKESGLPSNTRDHLTRLENEISQLAATLGRLS